MFRRFIFVAWIWHIIVGGWIIFSNGERWCLACREVGLTLIGMISIALGLVGLISGLRASNPMPGRG